MRRTSLFLSTGFRLVAWYATVFGASVAILLSIVYWIAVAAVNQQLHDSVLRETRLLVDIYNTRGLDALERSIQRRISELTSPRRYYVLQDAEHRLIAGNLPPLAPIETFTVMSVPEPEALRNASVEQSDEPDSMLAQGRKLAHGEYLLVGENRYRVVKAKEAIISAVAWGTALTVLLALGGGVLLAVNYLRRIEEVNRTIRSIMEGNLSQRFKTRGSSDEMDQLAANLNEMLGRIQALMDSVRRVSDDVAHDLRTPLSRLRQRLEDARSKCNSASDYERVIGGSVAEIDAILDTFGALLRIAQVESRMRRSGFAEVELSALCSNVAEIYKPVAEDRGQQIRIECEEDVRVHGDRELLLQMLANLVENAIQHGGSGARITIEVSACKGEPVLRVTDTGPGIPARENDKVFRRFYRLETSRTTPGNGLGLALVKAVVDLHDARVELSDNRPGLGVAVHFVRNGPVQDTALATLAPEH